MDRTFNPSNSNGIGKVYLDFLINLNGTSGAVVLEGRPLIASVTHTNGTNVWLVTMTDPIFKIVNIATEVRDDAGNGQYASTGSVTNEGTKNPITFKIQTFNAAGSVQNDSTLIVGISMAVINSGVLNGN